MPWQPWMKEASRLLEARWLGEDKAKTLNHLANKFNVSAERIRQIEKIAMEKLKVANE